MTRVFISQPLRGKSSEEIKQELDRATYLVKSILGDEIEIIDSASECDALKTIPLQALSISLEALAFCDYAYFCRDWQNARGCKIERQCAEEYGIKIIE